MRSFGFLVALILVGGCSGSDPGDGQAGPSDDPGGAASKSDSGTSHADAGKAGTGGIPVQPPDDPGVLVSNPVDAFTSSGHYVSGLPAMRANDNHSGTSVTGKPCLGCHDGVTCVKFDFAGTVYKAPALTEGAGDVEVRIIDAHDYAHTVHSDADGNFWHFSSKDLPMPALSGVRTADFTAIGTLNGTSCNTCHYDGNTHPTRLFVK